MKILFHINGMNKGGAERVAGVLLNKMAKDGHDVTLVTLWKDNEEYEIDSGIKRVVVSENVETSFSGIKGKVERFKLALERIMGVRRAINECKPDIVVSFLYKANLRAAMALIGKNIPLLMSVRNDPAFDYLPHKTGMKLLERKAKGCVFQTEKAMGYFDKRLTKNSAVIINPLSEKFLFPAVRHEVRMDADNEFPYKILSIGRLTPQKNHLLTIDALARIKDDYTNTELYIYGVETDEGAIPEISVKLKEYGLEKRVHLMGLTDNVTEIMADSDIFVLASDYEGLPNVVMEAMAVGLPVLSTDCPCGGPATLIEDGINGVLTPVGDVDSMAGNLRRLLSDAQLRKSISEASGDIIKKADPDEIYGQWMKLISGLI